MKLRDALTAAANQLATSSATPRLDAELLAAHAWGVDRNQLLLTYLDAQVPRAFAALVERRQQREPIAYITGQASFWSLDLQVCPGVLIPRPDSETLIEAALAHFGALGPKTVLDLGTGSGALLLAALDCWPEARGLGLDQSRAALDVAEGNAQRAAMQDRILFQIGDWGQGLAGPFDLILCNPPYIADTYPLDPDVVDFEPMSALFAGPDGLDAYHRLAPDIARLLSPNGCACVEIGYDQGVSAGDIFRALGLNVKLRQDLAGQDRCLVLRKEP